jgi:hypothetical protein
LTGLAGSHKNGGGKDFKATEQVPEEGRAEWAAFPGTAEAWWRAHDRPSFRGQIQLKGKTDEGNEDSEVFRFLLFNSIHCWSFDS